MALVETPISAVKRSQMCETTEGFDASHSVLSLLYKSKFDYHVSLADALLSKDLRHLRDFSICILDMEDEEVDHLELEPLVAKIVERFHEDVFAAATYDLLMTDIDFEDFFIGMIETGRRGFRRTTRRRLRR